jgi:GTP-binding protein HflX
MSDAEGQPAAERERALLVGVDRSGQHGSLAERLAELALLADTAGCDIVASLTQARGRADNRTYIGKGKLEELAAAAEEHQPDLVIFDTDLTPAQGRNIEAALTCRVVDRTQLILDIFAKRASTRLARDQVELALLQYSMPRYRKMWSHLSRIEGGVGMRGPGETQLEVDRRRARERIAHLQDRLSDAEQQKTVAAASRGAVFTVSLVGYTNVGKSTLMNALTGADVFVENRLFATLDATTRRLTLDGHEVLLSDTVGFIRDLPHSLVASFHATLSEVREADLLLHVVDIASDELEAQMASVQLVLTEIGAQDQPRLTVFNKVDALDPEADAAAIAARHGGGVLLSAREGLGLAELRADLVAAIEAARHVVTLDIPLSDGRTLAYVEAHGRVLSREFGDHTARLRVVLPEAEVGRLARFRSDGA